MPCVELSITAGKQLEHEMEKGWLPPEKFKSMVNAMAGVDMFDDSERTEAICNFEGVTSLSEVKAILEDNGSAPFKFGYAYFVNQLENQREMSTLNVRHLSNRYTYAYSYNDMYVDQQQSYVDLIRTIESSGITRLYTELGPMMQEVNHGRHPGPYSMEDYTPAPLSNAPVQIQCRNIANEIRNVLDFANEIYGEYGRNPETYITNMVNTWLGMADLSLDTITRYTCSILEGAAANGLDGVYSALDDLGVIDHLLKAGYQELQHHADREESYLTKVLNPDENTYYYYYYRPPEEKMAQYEDRLRFWSAVRNMNLLNLQLD